MSLSLASLSPSAMRCKHSCSSSRLRAGGKEPVLLARRRVKNSPLSISKSHAVHMVTTSMGKCMHHQRVLICPQWPMISTFGGLNLSLLYPGWTSMTEGSAA